MGHTLSLSLSKQNQQTTNECMDEGRQNVAMPKACLGKVGRQVRCGAAGGLNGLLFYLKIYIFIKEIGMCVRAVRGGKPWRG